MSVTLTTSAQTASGSTLTFASTSGVTTGMTVSGTNIAGGTTVSTVTGTTVTLSQAVTGTVASGATITFNTVTQVSLTTAADAPSGTVLPFWDTTGVTAGMYAFGTNIANGATVASLTHTSVTLSSALTGDVPAQSTVNFSTNSSFTPTPTPSPTITPLTTSAATAINTKVLTFSATTGVTAGMYAYGTGIANGTLVASTTSTTVTLSRNVTGPIPSGTQLLFSTIQTMLPGGGFATPPTPAPSPSPTPTPTSASTNLRNITSFLKTLTSTNGKTYFIPGGSKGSIGGSPLTGLPHGLVNTYIPMRATAPAGASPGRVRATAPQATVPVLQARQPAPSEFPRFNPDPVQEEPSEQRSEGVRHEPDGGIDLPPPETHNTP